MIQARIPVTVFTSDVPAATAGTAVIRLARPPHQHAGTPCPACASEGDIRVTLFNLLEEVRQGLRATVTHVHVDTSALPSPQPVIDALIPGRLPAFGLRDHAVARSFVLRV